MKIAIVGTKTTGWELILDEEVEPICVVEHASFEEAIDVFAANMPEYSLELDELKCDDFCGTTAEKKQRHNGQQRKRGSGARFRELILQGKTNAECLAIVRGEFPESKATLSDAAWNRAALRKGLKT